jgi:RNA polymerase sigma-70 factor, ECF subfamily
MTQQTTVNETPPSERDAINELFAQHYKASFRTAQRILRSREDSEDAVQNAYCSAFRNFHRFRGESSFKTWLTSIVVNCCLLQLRKRRAKALVALDDVQRTLASHAATPEALCYLRELQAAHAKAASELPQILRDVYTCSVISGVAFPNVTHRLGLTTAAAKSRLLRARRRVEHSLQLAVEGRAA